MVEVITSTDTSPTTRRAMVRGVLAAGAAATLAAPTGAALPMGSALPVYEPHPDADLLAAGHEWWEMTKKLEGSDLFAGCDPPDEWQAHRDRLLEKVEYFRAKTPAGAALKLRIYLAMYSGMFTREIDGHEEPAVGFQCRPLQAVIQDLEAMEGAGPAWGAKSITEHKVRS